jgi:DNA-binding NarL/FixJ family response regulator
VVVIPAASTTPRADRGQAVVTTLIIDRQPLFVAALGSLLRTADINANVVTAVRSDEGLEIIRGPERVDMVFCELRADPVSGIDLVRTLAQEHIPVPVMLLGDEGDETEMASALALNAAGLFTKNAALEEFLDGVQAVLAGHRAIGSGLLDRMVDRLSHPGTPQPRHGMHHLSPTELEILAMIGRAHSIPSIAASRGISHKTVRNHLAKIYRKLELHGRTEAMLWAARMGLTGT